MSHHESLALDGGDDPILGSRPQPRPGIAGDGSLWSRWKGLQRTRSKAGWMLADQAVCSIGNFVTGNLLARHLSPNHFGAYALVLETMFFLNSLQAAVVNYPLTLQAATGGQATLRRTGTCAILFTLLLLPILGTCLFGAAAASAGWAIGATAVAAMLLWQLQETLRRGLIADARISACIPGDVVCYLGHAGGILALWKLHRLNVPAAFMVIGGNSALAALIQAWQIGPSPIAWSDCRALAREWWKLGRWMLLSNLTGAVTQLGYSWTLRGATGASAVAGFAAITAPLKLANPIVASVGSLVTPSVARAWARHGSRAATRTALRFGLLGAAAIFPYFALLAILPGWSLARFYGHASPYVAHAPLLRIFVLNFTLAYTCTVLTAWLTGLHESRLQFFAEGVHFVVALSIALPVTALFGLRGLVLGSLLAATVNALMLAFFVRRTVRRIGAVPVTHPETAL